VPTPQFAFSVHPAPFVLLYRSISAAICFGGTAADAAARRRATRASIAQSSREGWVGPGSRSWIVQSFEKCAYLRRPLPAACCCGHCWLSLVFAAVSQRPAMELGWAVMAIVRSKPQLLPLHARVACAHRLRATLEGVDSGAAGGGAVRRDASSQERRGTQPGATRCGSGCLLCRACFLRCPRGFSTCVCGGALLHGITVVCGVVVRGFAIIAARVGARRGERPCCAVCVTMFPVRGLSRSRHVR
jgi:hypothetical protein